MTQTVLVINSGSSSIKYQLISPSDGKVLAKGLCERIAEGVGHLSHTNYSDNPSGEKTEIEQEFADHSEGLSKILALFEEKGPNLTKANIVAVGHRTVQGGRFNQPSLITDELTDALEELKELAPLHNPPGIKGIEVGRKLLPDVPHVACFDTAFFADLPAEASRYAIERTVADRYQIRRYGFHGTSHQFVSTLVANYLGNPKARIIVLHLGNGASVSAVKAGKALDTSMGLTPLEGLVMGTRSGDVDPALVIYLQRVAGMSVDEVDELLNRKSGLLGLTGTNDMREVRQLLESGSEEEKHHAREGLDILIHRLLHYIGAYTAILGGVDVIAFTAGIGENDQNLRREVIERLSSLGIELDPKLNEKRSDEPRVISTPASIVKVMVVPTNEELAIARQALEIVTKA